MVQHKSVRFIARTNRVKKKVKYHLLESRGRSQTRSSSSYQGSKDISVCFNTWIRLQLSETQVQAWLRPLKYGSALFFLAITWTLWWSLPAWPYNIIFWFCSKLDLLCTWEWRQPVNHSCTNQSGASAFFQLSLSEEKRRDVSIFSCSSHESNLQVTKLQLRDAVKCEATSRISCLCYSHVYEWQSVEGKV